MLSLLSSNHQSAKMKEWLPKCKIVFEDHIVYAINYIVLSIIKLIVLHQTIGNRFVLFVYILINTQIINKLESFVFACPASSHFPPRFTHIHEYIR